MTEAVLTLLRDFSSKTDSFEGRKPNGRPGLREPDPRGPRGQPREGPSERGRAQGEERPCSLDIESALAWLRWELMEMRSQDQVLIRQLMELHAGIQELKQELSEENQNDDDDDDDDVDEDDDDDDDGDKSEDHSSWESCSQEGSVNSGETEFSVSCLKLTMSTPLSTPPYWLGSTANRVRSTVASVSSRRSSVP